MKTFISSIAMTFVMISYVSCAHLAKRQSNVNLDDIQSLLKELEKQNVNINDMSKDLNNNINKNGQTVRNETPVRDALTRLFGAFQQLTSAYVGVLTSVGKSIGLPSIGAKYLDNETPTRPESPIVIKQIQENFRQFQDTVQEVSKTVSNLVTRQGPVDSYIVVNELSKFVNLWAKQLQEVSEQVTRAFGGLEAEPADSETTMRTIPPALRELWQNVVKTFDDTVNSVAEQVNKLIAGGGGEKKGNPSNVGVVIRGDEPKQSSNLDIMREFKNLLELIQKRVKALTQQLDTLVSSTSNTIATNGGKPQPPLSQAPDDNQLPAEHREGVMNFI